MVSTRLFLLICFCSVYITVTAQYPVFTIPDSLAKSANMVKRTEETTIEIKNIGKARILIKYAYTILNEAGDRFAYFIDYYDRFRQINSITGTLYDALGTKIKQVKKKDIEDEAVDDNMSLATDSRTKYHNFYYKKYPYTVEYETEIEISGIFDLPDWRPVPRHNISVINSKFTIVTPADYTLRYKYNQGFKPVINSTASNKTYSWELKNTIAPELEIYGPDWDEITPVVLTAPTDFEIDGYKGSMDTWLHFGQFMNKLYAGKDVLPPAIKQKVHELTNGLADNKEKVKAIYNFLQQNTRYISIQLGIGGWQPFDASFVATKKYGDCKALSNYMVAMLKEAGIKGNTVLIYGGDEEDNMITDFPSNQFNHAIACVPLGKDTIWLECTSQTKQAGFMGSFTGNRKALLINDEGGYVVSTPYYKSNSNLQLRKIEAVIDENGNLITDINTRFTGEQQELHHSLIHSSTKEQRDKYLNTRLSLPTYTVTKTDYTEINNSLPEVYETLKIEAPNYATVTGKRLFIVPNIFNKSSTRLAQDKERKNIIRFKSCYKDVDTINIKIPAGYKPESLPKNIEINNAYGKYSTTYNIKDNDITLIRIHEKNAAQYPASAFAEVAAYYETIYKADRAKIVFVKAE